MATIKGLDRLTAKLNDISEADYKQAMNKAVLLVSNQAKLLTPVDTGDLRGSIRSHVRIVSPKNIVGIVGTSLEYAPYVEFGTGVRGMATNTNENVNISHDPAWTGQEAQPYLYPAITMNKERIIKIFSTDLVKAIRTKNSGGNK